MTPHLQSEETNWEQFVRRWGGQETMGCWIGCGLGSVRLVYCIVLASFVEWDLLHSTSRRPTLNSFFFIFPERFSALKRLHRPDLESMKAWLVVTLAFSQYFVHTYVGYSVKLILLAEDPDPFREYFRLDELSFE